MDAGEIELFTDSVRRATERTSGTALDEALAALGWTEALEADRRRAVAVLFEAQGRANATSSALDQLLSAALGLPDPDAAAVVLPSLRGTDAPGHHDAAHLAVGGLGTPTLTRRDTAVVAAASGGGGECFTVPVSALKLEPTRGLDPAFGLVEVSAHLDQRALGEPTASDWSTALAVGQLALGHELVGAGRTMLELARRHALERVQFGRPIASFQAVRHRLAESFVALDAADALLAAAWDEPEPDPTIAAMAKAFAGQSGRTVARHCQQVLAGIGFTTEHDLHRFVRRTIVLDQLLGASSVLTRRLGAEVLATGSLPASLPL
ncbi:MAG TPA: acyl-CoA dehydrogenase family protein [Acidimicrobiales bacterium]|nr:acyl-CoA dehydrogenase family protein [Acidimicrobiales bacterium]